MTDRERITKLETLMIEVIGNATDLQKRVRFLERVVNGLLGAFGLYKIFEPYLIHMLSEAGKK